MEWFTSLPLWEKGLIAVVGVAAAVVIFWLLNRKGD